MSLTLSPTLIADAPPLELLDHEPIAVPVARPVCAAAEAEAAAAAEGDHARATDLRAKVEQFRAKEVELREKAERLRAEARAAWDRYYAGGYLEVYAAWADVVREHYPTPPAAPGVSL